MKITADMLTEEFGFVGGAIISYECKPTNEFRGACNCDYFDKDDDLFIDDILWAHNDCNGEIRVLTGPMSIWNHAPRWADGLIELPGSRQMEWITKYSPWFDNAECIKRPWWVPKEQE